MGWIWIEGERVHTSCIGEPIKHMTYVITTATYNINLGKNWHSIDRRHTRKYNSHIIKSLLR